MSDMTEEQEQAILRKFATTYRTDVPKWTDHRWIDPELLAGMTPVEALVILQDESYALLRGLPDGGPVVSRAWELLWEIAEDLEKS